MSKLPTGVYARGSRYEVCLSINGRFRYLGSAPSPAAAELIARAVRKVAPAVVRCKKPREGLPCV